MSGSNIPKIWPAGGDAFVRTFALLPDDHIKVHYAAGHPLALGPTLGVVAVIALFAALMSGYDEWRAGDYAAFAGRVIAVVGVAGLATLALVRPARWAIRRGWEKRLKAIDAIGVEFESRVDRNGVSHGTADGQTHSYPWDSIRAVEREDGYYYFWFSQLSCHPWPDRVFASDEERASFEQAVRDWSGREIASPAVLARLGEAGRRKLKERPYG